MSERAGLKKGETPKLKRDWIGLRVRVLCKLRNGMGTMDKGVIATVTDSFGGLRIETDKCEHCGLSMIISKVHERDVEIIGRDDRVTAQYANYRRRK